MRNTAKQIFQFAANLDPRLINGKKPDELSAIVDAWSAVFEDNVWLDEGKQAVIEHYRQPRAFQITAGDVLDFCSRQPAWSSRDHARAFLRKWSHYPFSHVVDDFTGREPPSLDSDVPDVEGRRAHAAAVLSGWVEQNLEELVDCVLERKYLRM